MSRSRKTSVRISFAVAALLVAAPTLAQESTPVVASVTLVDGTPAMRLPGAFAQNLDAGDLVAGNTEWDLLGNGFFFRDTRVGFLWSPDGGSSVFAESENTFFEPNFVLPRAVSPNRTVVGGDILSDQVRTLPFMWTPEYGYLFLPTPCVGRGARPGDVPLGACSGGAAAVSDDGSIAVGTVFESVTSPAQAARWVTRRLRTLPLIKLERLAPDAAWSDAFDVSRDGTVVVGDSGPAPDAVAAARWVDGSPSPMQAVGASSSALLVADDGSAAIGWADDGGRKVLVRWSAGGAAEVFSPPDGTTLVAIHAINPAASAAAGTLRSGDNWAPFLWTASDGFTVVPELGEPAYDRSEALDVSDDGSVVVGALQAGVVSNGFPRSYGFLWSARTGLVRITDLMVAHGQSDADYFRVAAISGDGARLLAVGNPPGSARDTQSVIVELAPY